MKTTGKAKLVSIKSPKACAQTVMQLERFVELAKAGKIKNVFIVAEYYNADDPTFVQAGEYDPVRTLGLLEWAKTRWLDTEIITYFEDQNDDEPS